MSGNPIYVTKPSLPPLEEFIPYLEEVWKSEILTNGGPMHDRLERALAEYLGVGYVALFNNGTSALMTALQALNLTGEVITTPYSFIATANSIAWNNLSPVFVDIDPLSLNLDPSKIEAAITDETTAILPVHCYGNPCDVTAIQQIADRRGLKVLYDAAHAFGVKDSGGSLLRHGDLSVLSFHATKVFNTFEGGAIICHDLETKKRIDQLKNFGIVDEVTVVKAGANGKMCEVSAAFGLLQLKHIDEVLIKRKAVDELYRKLLDGVNGVTVAPVAEEGRNYSYFPLLVEKSYPLSRDQLLQCFNDKGVFPRRYFFPLISSFLPYRHSNKTDGLTIAKNIAEKIICLPIYPDLHTRDIHSICEVIVQNG